VVSDAAPAGDVWWYRVRTSAGTAVLPAISVRSEASIGLAQVEFEHNVPETDLALTLGTGLLQSLPEWQQAVDLRENVSAVSVSAPQDLVRHDLVVPLFSEAASALPPLPQIPWWIRAVEGGNPARSGYLRDFSITTGGNTYTTNSTTPQPTQEGAAASLWIPEPATLAIREDRGNVVPVVAAPNPFRSRTSIELQTAEGGVRVSIHDLAGREVRVLWSGNGGDLQLTWDGRDGFGGQVPAGAYFLRVHETNQVRALRTGRCP